MSALWQEWLLSPVALGVLGLAVGSFLNVVVHRLPQMMARQWWGEVAGQLQDEASHREVFDQALPADATATGRSLETALHALPRLNLAVPRSRCPACGHALSWSENVPLLGWLRLRGRCAACGARIPVRYPAIEALTALLFAAIGWRVGPQPAALMWCGVAAVLVALSAIDWDTTLLPDSLTQPLTWAGLVAAVAGWSGLAPEAALIGAVSGYLALWSVHWLFFFATRKEGMGHGDFKLLAALGAWLGWQAILPIVLMASVIGALVGLGMKMAGQLREGRYVPFGPFLAGGGLVVMLAGTGQVLTHLGW
ncbi:MAG: A24 family peptidase [Betaproteobacteria bacterium]|jgi:leader peptidase (prepilin peptidase)/N-methyltransferase